MKLDSITFETTVARPVTTYGLKDMKFRKLTKSEKPIIWLYEIFRIAHMFTSETFKPLTQAYDHMKYLLWSYNTCRNVTFTILYTFFENHTFDTRQLIKLSRFH